MNKLTSSNNNNNFKGVISRWSPHNNSLAHYCQIWLILSQTPNKDFDSYGSIFESIIGCPKTRLQTFYFIPQKWLILESKVKLEVKTMGQEL